MYVHPLGPRVALCGLLLLLGPRGGPPDTRAAPPTAAAATPAIFEGQGLIELIRPTDLIADGASPVEIALLALGPDGAPIVGLIKPRLVVTGGEATELVEKGAGWYAFTLTPAALDQTGGVRVELNGKLLDKRPFSRFWTLPVSPARNHALGLTASPTALTLGVDKTASIAFHLGGGDAQALAATRLVHSVSTGVLANLTHLGGGQFSGLYTPPAATSPQLALLTAVDAADPSRTYASVVLPLSAKVDQSVSVAPKSNVILKVGGREFGPIQADSKGRAKVSVIVPPGTESAIRVQIAPGGVVTEAPLDLALPASRRIALFPPPNGIPADGRLQVTVRALVVTPDGRPDEAAQVVFSASTGAISAPRHEGAGVYATTYTPPFANATTPLKISVKLADQPPAQADTRTLSLVPVRATQLTLVADPLAAAAATFTVRAHVGGPDGAPLATRALTFSANGARFQEVKDLKSGDYQATFTVTGKAGSEVTATVLTAPTPNPLAHVLLVPALERLPADGLSSTLLTVATVDEFGYPVPNIEVTLRLVSGDGSLPPSVVTNASGSAQIYYTAGRKNGFVGIEASAQDRGAGTSLVQAPPSVPLPDLPVVGDAWTRALHAELAAGTAILKIPRVP